MSMTTASTTDHDRYREVARILHDVAKPMRVLSALGWDASVRDEFLAGGATQLPAPTYTQINPEPGARRRRCRPKRLLRPGNVVDEWLDREATAIEATALMLSSLGTPAFHAYSRQLYGVPKQPLRFDPATPLELAEQIQANVAELDERAPDAATGAVASPARQVAAQLKIAVDEHFGAGAPEILVVDELSANAVASTSRIKIRRDAQFTAKDAAQLLNHEAFIHVATGLNGREQTDIPILAIGHPGTTRTQEGLAVYSEYVSGTLDLDRLRRLADRILSVQMVIDGADFIEVYRWFLDRSATPEQAFESTRRNFRGGVITGGSPFTKDCSYLSGFLSISTFVRSAFIAGRPDTLGSAVLGQARPVVDRRARRAAQPGTRQAGEGTCRRGRSTPGWVLSHLTLNAFVANVDLTSMGNAVGDILDNCPRVEIDPNRLGRVPDIGSVHVSGHRRRRRAG